MLSPPPPPSPLQVYDSEEHKFLLHQAQIIDELEATVPAWLERRCPHWYPPYIIALVLQPSEKKAITLEETTWPGSGASPFLNQLASEEDAAMHVSKSMDKLAVDREASAMLGDVLEQTSSISTLQLQMESMVQQMDKMSKMLEKLQSASEAAGGSSGSGCCCTWQASRCQRE
jgi:hypothetical protein